MKRFGKRDCRFWHYKYNIHDNAQTCLCLVGKNIVYNSDSEVLLTAMKHNYLCILFNFEEKGITPGFCS